MIPWVIVALSLALIISLIVCFFLFKRKRETSKQPSGILSLQDNINDLAIEFEELSSLTEIENASLVEIEDKQLIARIDQAIPGARLAVEKAGAAMNAGKLYRAILPAGAQLAKAKGVEGAYRGFVLGAKGIEAQPLLVPAGKGVAAIHGLKTHLV